jgi:RNA polymerase subunit RPABC4/transcription elongation factor Spt4
MDEEQIKSLRHSFTNPHREDLPKPKVNKFGHTILGDEKVMQESEIDLKIDELGNISADPKQSLFDSPQFQKWVENQPNTKTPEPEEPVQKEEKLNIHTNNVIIANLLSELDEMDGTAERKQAKDQCYKNCFNKDCMYNLPKDAKFCLECGTAQIPKYCTECGYSFPGMEKFCPDCGNKR